MCILPQLKKGPDETDLERLLERRAIWLGLERYVGFHQLALGIYLAYGLKLASPQNSYAETNSQDDALRMWDLWEVTGS